MPSRPAPFDDNGVADDVAGDGGGRVPIEADVAGAIDPPLGGAAGSGPGGVTLLSRARAALDEAGAALGTGDLVRAVFGATVPVDAAATPWGVMLERLLVNSNLFARDGAGRWRLAAWDLARRSLDTLEWAVIDIETTGLAPGRHHVIEVGGVIVRGGEPREDFQRLINPERRIPQFIAQFTGIKQHMVNRAAGAASVLPRFHAFIGDRVVVGHNVGFDLGFLAYETDRLGLSIRFPDDGLDTIALARRYLTGMRRASLDRVASALHIPVRDRHRALPDALITARVFALLLARAREDGCETLDDLRAALAHMTPDRVNVPVPRPTGNLYLNPAWRRDFPTRPGVYLMKDAAGEVIYVGKAICLKDRLASYYNQPLGYTRKMDGLLQSVREIETRVLGSELEALLVESRLIKQLQPRYNVQLRNYEHYPFIKVDVGHGYPRIYATREVAADGARYFGPFRSQRIVDATVDLLHRIFPIRSCTRALPPQAPPSEPCFRYHLKRCPAPCRGELDAEARDSYHAAVEEACAFLGGERMDLIDRLRAEMFAASARQDFERAARLRDALRDADQVLLGQRLVAGAVDANNLLIAYPSSEEGHAELFLVRHGRLVAQHRCLVEKADLDEALRALLDDALRLGPPPARVGRAEVDQINIIARWIHRHSDEETRSFFRLPADGKDSDVGEEWVAATTAAIMAGIDPGDNEERFTSDYEEDTAVAAGDTRAVATSSLNAVKQE